MNEEKNTIKPIKRNEYGLIDGIEYIFDENGMVDWKAMIPPEFLYINPDQKRRQKIEEKYGKKYEELNPLIDKIEDNDLIILLAGIKYLLKLHGYNSVNYNVKIANTDYAAVSCEIEFIPTFETEMRTIRFSDNACAHLNNSTGFGQKYLLELATNRSFCRTVRNFLRINIVSREEILGSSSTEEEQPASQTIIKPDSILEKLMKDKGISFEKLKQDNPKIKQYNTVAEIPKNIIFDLIHRIKNNK